MFAKVNWFKFGIRKNLSLFHEFRNLLPKTSHLSWPYLVERVRTVLYTVIVTLFEIKWQRLIVFHSKKFYLYLF